jgi:hypothetical protein
MLVEGEYNYAKLITIEGDVVAVAAMEVGSDNEAGVVNWALDNDFTLVKIDEQEFLDFESDYDIELE